jgi:hypothetical protein
LSFSSEEEKAQRKAKQEAEVREANRRQAERRLELVEQRALGEQRAVLCEAELAVTKPADSSLGASFIDVSDRRDIRVKLHLPRPSGPLADAGGAAMLGATVVMVNGEAVRSTAHLAQCRQCGRMATGCFAKCPGRRRGITVSLPLFNFRLLRIALQCPAIGAWNAHACRGARRRKR